MNVKEYFSKMKGGAKSHHRVGLKEILWSWLGAVIGICSYLSSRYFEPMDLTLIVASFGAYAVLVYGAIKSPFGLEAFILLFY